MKAPYISDMAVVILTFLGVLILIGVVWLMVDSSRTFAPSSPTPKSTSSTTHS